MARKMDRSKHRRILHDLLCLPTAPFAEHHVMGYVERFCAQRKHVTLKHDAAGNMLVRVRKGKRRVARPVCITAHLDHPGFVAERMMSKRRLRAKWNGGVPVEYFPSSRVRFHVDGRWIRGRVRSIETISRNKQKRVDVAVLEVSDAVEPGSIGMWDLPEPTVRGTRIYARACDDLAGAAAMLCTIDEITRGRESCDAYFLFTRAEEVGFAGAIAAARLKTVPRKCVIVVTETSLQLPHARLGDGPILRVGDRASSFTPQMNAYCQRVARDLAQADRGFRYQRKLMDGGTCEASAFCTLGYEATCVCLALGNHHNVDRKRKKLALEYVDLNDFDNAVRLFVALARARQPYTGRDDALRSQLRKIDQTYKGLLRRSRSRPPCSGPRRG